MKITITGHTAGFGKILADYFSIDHEVVGISRRTGFELDREASRQDFVSHLSGDVVILNTRVGQVETLDAIKHSQWAKATEPRTVIVMGSRAPDAGLVSQAPLYAADKARVDFFTRHTAVEMSKELGVRVILLKPTYLSGCKHDDQRCVDSTDVCEIVNDLLTVPRYSSVREMTLYPLHTLIETED